MPDLTQITGGVVLPDGSVPFEGRIHFTPTGWDAPAAGKVQPPATRTFVLGVGGGLVDVYLSPSTTSLREQPYRVSVTHFNSATRAMETTDLGLISVPEVAEGESVSIRALLSDPGVLPTAPDALAQITAKALEVSSDRAAAQSARTAAEAAAAIAQSGTDVSVEAFSELSSRLRYSGATGSQLNVTAGMYVRDRSSGAIYLVLASGASGADLDYTGSGGVRLQYVALDNKPASVLRFHAGGPDIRAAILAAVSAVKAGRLPSRHVVVPWQFGGWTVSAQTLIDASDITFEILGDIRLTATTAQHCLLFAPDATETPATALTNVQVIGRKGVVVDGNADAMTFLEPAPGSVDTYSAVRFNSIRGLRVYGIHATNGPMDAMSCKRCPGHIIENCEFSYSLWDNGFSATTDPADYSQTDPSTWGGGTVRDCIAHDNNDFGMTAYNCSGQWFENCRAWGNEEGFSYEDAFSTPNVKKYFGGFRGCHAFGNLSRGYYIDGDEVTIDDTCRSWDNRGTAKDQTDNLWEHGVCVSNVNRCYIGGRHEGNGRCGIALFNGSALDMQVTIGAECIGNDWHGIYLREQSRVKVLPIARIVGNGAANTQYGGEWGHGIYATSTTIAMAGKGVIEIDGCEISGNAFRAARVGGYARASMRGVWGSNNFQHVAAGSSVGLLLENMNTGVAENCDLTDTTGRQTFVVNINSDVTNGREHGSKGNGSSGIVANTSSTSRLSTKPATMTTSQSWTIPTIAAGSRTSTTLSVVGADVGDYVDFSFSGDIGLRVASAYVASAGQVVVYLANFTGVSIAGETLTVRAQVVQRNAR